jgi:hypothetical protein
MSHQAIRNIHSNAVSIFGDFPDIQAWDKDGNTIIIDFEKVKKEIDALNESWTSLEYQRQRSSEYPSIGDQLDALFHAGVFPPEMAAKIQAVKNKYPKGS